MQTEPDPRPEPSTIPEGAAANPCGTPKSVVARPVVLGAAIWDPNATANWSLLFTPAFGSFLQALNWEAMGEPAEARKSKHWFFVSLGVLVLMAVLSIINAGPEGNPFIVRGLGFGYLVIWYFASGRRQAGYVKERFGHEYLRRHWSAPLLIGLGCGVAFLIAVYTAAVGYLLLRS